MPQDQAPTDRMGRNERGGHGRGVRNIRDKRRVKFAIKRYPQQQRKNQSDCAIRADPAVPHDGQPFFRRPPSEETIGSIRKTILMQCAGYQNAEKNRNLDMRYAAIDKG